MYVIPVLGGLRQEVYEFKVSLSFTNNAGSGRHTFNPCTWGAELLSVKPSGVHSKFWDSQGKGKGWVKELH